jgi:hypothetical protein
VTFVIGVLARLCTPKFLPTLLADYRQVAFLQSRELFGRHCVFASTNLLSEHEFPKKHTTRVHFFTGQRSSITWRICSAQRTAFSIAIRNRR